MIANPPISVTVQAREVNGVTLLQVAERILAASRTTAGRWYDVTDGACGCLGFEHRRHCAHVTAAAELTKPPRICILCGEAREKLSRIGECLPCIRRMYDEVA